VVCLNRKRTRVLYICNLLSDKIINERDLRATAMTCTGRLIPTLEACRDTGIPVWAVSSGRNRQRGTWGWHSSKIARVDGAPVLFAAFWDAPILTHLITMVSLGLIILRLRRRTASAVFWNAMPHYVLALFMTQLAGIRCVLDLEDGLREDIKGVTGKLQGGLLYLWDKCAVAAMVSNVSLLKQIKTRPAYPYYGVAPGVSILRSWDDGMRVLFSGHLSKETGVEDLIEALLILKTNSPQILTGIRIIAVGDGPLASQMSAAAANELFGVLEYRGRVTDAEYKELLGICNIGLCLKMPDNSMGQSTFPSKVIEFASNGLLVVSYRVSDVPLLFPEDGSCLMDAISSQELASKLEWIARNPKEARNKAESGRRAICERLNPRRVGRDLGLLWLDSGAKLEIARSLDKPSGGSTIIVKERV